MAETIGKEQAIEIIERLRREYPDAKTALNFSNPMELLVATILSAQCTDKRVNEITSSLFKKYKSVSDYASANQAVFEQEIRSAGFYHNKAKNIIAAAQAIESHFAGQVPRTMKEMLELPGVARKTANVVLSEAYGVVDGIAVDTHVKRLSNRLKFSISTDPKKIELDLMAIFPRSYWYDVCNTLIAHGRNVCLAKNPLCRQCKLNELCRSAFKF